MLIGHFNGKKHKEHMLAYPDSWFSQIYEPEWGDNPMVSKIIKEIDKSDFIPPYNVVSPIYGSIPMDWLSHGTKSLIYLACAPEYYVYSAYMGDNCAPLLKEISDDHDVHIVINHIFEFVPDQVIYFPEYDITTHNEDELIKLIGEHYDDFKERDN